MKTKALRLYGKRNLKLEEFELPEIKEDEILVSITTDDICMSTWKLANLGAEHKKAPHDIAVNPVMTGHEFCGNIFKVGKKWQGKYSVGDRFIIQPNLLLAGKYPGYSYKYCGGDATYAILPNDVMEQDCLLSYKGETYFEGSLTEPLSCVIGAFNAQYHLVPGTYDHVMGIKEGGNLLILGGTGPMGLLAIDYALHGTKVKAKNIVVTDINAEKLARAEKLYPSQNGINVRYVNTQALTNEVEALKDKVDGIGYDDIFVLVPVPAVISDASALLNADGCLNFFSGPQNNKLSAEINFYDIHYSFTHYVGTSGGNIGDLKEAVELIESGKVTVANIVTHILGLNDAAETTLDLPDIPGGKKLVYTQKNIPRFELEKLNPESELGRILAKTEGVWSKAAEDYILEAAEEI